jgi:hypothetical protein
MTRRTYTLQPERLKAGQGYVPCEPHQASRVVVRETTLVPGRAGRKPYRITRTLETFYGSGMMLAARATLDRLTCRTKPKPTKRGIYARSLTIAEYDEVMRRTRYQGSY